MGHLPGGGRGRPLPGDPRIGRLRRLHRRGEGEGRRRVRAAVARGRGVPDQSASASPLRRRRRRVVHRGSLGRRVVRRPCPSSARPSPGVVARRASAARWTSVYWDDRPDPHPSPDPDAPHPRCPLAKPPRSPPTASATGSSTTTPWSAGARSPSGSIRTRSEAWRYQGPTQRGAQFQYSDLAIECLLTLRAVYHLTLRATEGFARSLFELMGVDLPVPDYTTLCRRAATVRITLPKKADRAAPPGPRQHRAEGLRRGRVEGPPARLLQAADLAEAPPGRRPADARDPGGDGDRAGGDRCGDGPRPAGAGGQPDRGCGGGRGVRPAGGVRRPGAAGRPGR